MLLTTSQLVYFSPTHTGARSIAAMSEATQLEELDEVDLTCESSSETIKCEADVTFVAAPVYGGRVAPLALQRFENISSNGGAAVAVVVYGNRDYEDALVELSDFLVSKGFKVIAAAAVIGEHSYSRQAMPIAQNRPDNQDLMWAKAFGRQIVEKLSDVDSLQELTLVQVPGNRPYKVLGASSKQAPVVDSELCTQCGHCMQVCPVQAISLSDDAGTVSDAELCIKCCVCVKECPEGARRFDTPYTEYLFKLCSERREPEYFL